MCHGLFRTCRVEVNQSLVRGLSDTWPKRSWGWQWVWHLGQNTWVQVVSLLHTSCAHLANLLRVSVPLCACLFPKMRLLIPHNCPLGPPCPLDSKRILIYSSATLTPINLDAEFDHSLKNKSPFTKSFLILLKFCQDFRGHRAHGLLPSYALDLPSSGVAEVSFPGLTQSSSTHSGVPQSLPLHSKCFSK